jgi:hypothetical protein
MRVENGPELQRDVRLCNDIDNLHVCVGELIEKTQFLHSRVLALEAAAQRCRREIGQLIKERDEARRTRDAAQAQSNRDLEERRKAQATADRMREALERQRQGLLNLLEVRRMQNGRYGNLTREEVEAEIAALDAAFDDLRAREALKE